MPDTHAILSASSSKMWLNCPPSALLNAKLPESSSPYAQQGTDAHSLCEFKLHQALGHKVRDPTEDLQNYDEEMENCANDYTAYVLSQIPENAQVFIEERLDFSKWVPGGFGTGDCIIIGDGTLKIIDFKYGLGVLVSAEQNTQMMLYALGAIDTYDMLYDIKEVQMTIFQPRRQNVSTYTISKEELLKWAEEYLIPRAKLAAEGKGEFHAGSHCQFCKIKATCRKRAEHHMELARYEFAKPETLTDEEVEDILDKVDGLSGWANDVKEYALQQALSGKKWKRWKVVEGRSNRKYTDEKAVADKVQEAGFDPYDHKLQGVTAMSKLLGKKKFDELLGGLVYKPKGKPTLVDIGDKRPEINTADEDFKEELS